MKLSLTCAVFSTLVCLTQAQAADNNRAQEKAAKKACAAGDFRKGVEILAGLYVDTDDTTHIYNQGRCYEQNHQWVNAVDRFREYLRKMGDLSTGDKAEVDKHIADCEEFLEKETKLAPPSPVATPVVAATPPPTTPEVVRTIVPETPAPEGNRGSGLRVTGIVLGSVGVAALAAGLVLNLKANSLASDFNKTPDPSTRSSQSSYKTGSMIGYGVGAGALLTGGVLYLIGRSSADAKTTPISFLPMLTPTELSLSLRRAFQ
jgi:hypothetical protein